MGKTTKTTMSLGMAPRMKIKNEQGGIDPSALDGLAASLFGGKQPSQCKKKRHAKDAQWTKSAGAYSTTIYFSAQSLILLCDASRRAITKSVASAIEDTSSAFGCPWLRPFLYGHIS